ncbi:MAG: ATP-binding cassette domain-containing protein [Scytolyngbya sp. HA4215-MV1]|jgi:ABC-type multidrug transport system ATPase subunit/pSer/pThr/pTyr-binding forkhead associated (FHA) protein/ABC-type multidrug transport system permease subunit|nr:ATP-binding cassette domain-containing protein [Scytolyngbya sp. HA4215-MV1]
MTQTTVLSSQPYLELYNQGEIVQLKLTGEQHQLGRDPHRADLVIPSDWQIVSGCHALLRRVGEDYCIYDGDGNKPSTNGLFLNRTRITPNRGYRLKNGTELRIGQYAKHQVVLTYHNPCSTEAGELPKNRIISLKDRSVLLGRDEEATLELDSPIVSRRHATIEPDGQGQYILRDLSMNGVFVNSQRVQGSALLPEGATIRIGPFTLVLRGDQLEVLDRGNQIRVDASDLVREVKDKRGKMRRLLDEVSFAIEPGQFVALVGGSGAGKSTLMRTLLGIEPTDRGVVSLNGDNLRSNFNIYRAQIGYVPQDDIVHRELTVVEVLTYAAKLRLPPDIDVNKVVNKTLEDIEMTERRDVLVNRLSGGQRKRVSIGVELLADPKLFFLDEPTSGLDPGLDKKMMQLLRKLADQGRTVVLVTHATANITMCDRIVFVGRGGRLCYFGPPKKALEFFGVESGDFADIYNELERGETVVQQWAAKFRQSDDCLHYVLDHLSPSNPEKPTTHMQGRRSNVSPFKQLALLTQRAFQLTLRDPVNLGLALLTAPIGISLINLAVRDKTPLIGATPPDDPTLAPLALRVLFVFTCAAIWVGLSSSLQEIVKESAIYVRERLVNLGLFAYLGSKSVVLGGLALLQTLLMMAVILNGFKDPKPDVFSWSLGLGVTTFLTLLACMSLGLMISAIVRNSSQANSALPLLLLPQIIFSGVLFKMEGFSSKISWLMLSRWSVGAYGSLVNVNGMVPKPVKLPDGSLVSQPFEPTPVYDPTWHNLSLNWSILLLHAALYMAVTFWVQKSKDVLK